jgi:hypothetical protein
MDHLITVTKSIAKMTLKLGIRCLQDFAMCRPKNLAIRKQEAGVNTSLTDPKTPAKKEVT